MLYAKSFLLAWKNYAHEFCYFILYYGIREQNTASSSQFCFMFYGFKLVVYRTYELINSMDSHLNENGSFTWISNQIKYWKLIRISWYFWIINEGSLWCWLFYATLSPSSKIKELEEYLLNSKWIGKLYYFLVFICYSVFFLILKLFSIVYFHLDAFSVFFVTDTQIAACQINPAFFHIFIFCGKLNFHNWQLHLHSRVSNSVLLNFF